MRPSDRLRSKPGPTSAFWSPAPPHANRACRREPSYKHPCYVSGVVKCRFCLAKAGDHPMKEAIWTKKYFNQLKAEAGPQRLPLGAEGRAALFSRPIFAAGPAEADDPLFWEPLLARYAGLRMQEGLQLKPRHFAEEDGVPVIHIRASTDQFLKSIQAARKIPVHPELIRLGLLRLVERKRRQGARWAFAVERGLDGTFSSAFSKLYHNWRVSEGIYGPSKDLHSIRKQPVEAGEVGGGGMGPLHHLR